MFVIKDRVGATITPRLFKSRQQAEQWAKANLTLTRYSIEKV